MARNIDVQEIINEQYHKQADILVDGEDDLNASVEQIRDEELQHLDIVVHNDERGEDHYKLLRAMIQSGCRAVIKIVDKV